MLKDRIAIITGAASGIGHASARLFAEHGAQVLAVDKPGDRVMQAHAGVASIVPFAMDVTAPEAPEAIVGAVTERWGRLDILFNNAGVGARVPGEAERRSILDTPDEHWRRLLDINLTSQFRLTKAAIPLLRRSGTGRVIATGSPLAYRTEFGIAAYTASKAGVAGLTIAVAIEEGGHGITANWLEPGAILTDMTREGYEGTENGKVWARKSPFNRLGEPIDIARVALFLASGLAGFVTGQGICVDGGITLRI